MIVAVSGWRDWTDTRFVFTHLYRYIHTYGTPDTRLYVRVGCARGVDRFVRGYAAAHPGSIDLTVYRADWDTYGKAAGPMRNSNMLQGDHEQAADPFQGVHADRLLAFPQPGINWDVDKSGTVSCIREAVRLGIDWEVPEYSGSE